MCLRALVCLCVYVSAGVFACARVCMHLYVMTSSYFLTTSYFTPLFFLFHSSPSLSRLPPFPPPLCGRFFAPSLFPPALKAALHHTSPLHSPSCFDLCYQGISCVRLMGFFSGYSGFPIHSLGCLELDFCCSFSKVGLYLGRIVYFSCIIFNSVFFLSFPSSLPPSFF